MAEIKMNYIFITKKKHESMCTQEIISELIDKNTINRGDDVLTFKYKETEVNILYRLVQRRNTDKCYLSLTAKLRANVALEVLEIIDSAITRSPSVKYYYPISDYNGIAEYHCLKLYPKFSNFERLLREAVYIVLTNAYGSAWYQDTVPDKVNAKIKEVSKGSSASTLISKALEEMDFFTLETYLFEKTRPECFKIIDEKLSKANLKEMDKHSICSIIEQMRPTSVWERNFATIGKADVWEQSIRQIHEMRNKVAHNKTINKNEFDICNKQLIKLNLKLSDAVIKLQDKNFTDRSSLDVLGSFIVMAAKGVGSVLDSDTLAAFQSMMAKTQSRISELSQSLVRSFNISASLKAITDNARVFEIAEQVRHLYNMDELKETIAQMKSLNSVPQITISSDLIQVSKAAKKIKIDIPDYSALLKSIEIPRGGQ